MITLSSDFGAPYPAAMKGVMLGRTDARLVDVTHDFPRQDVRTAAFWLREVLPWFPPSVHLVVIDPGVGTDRRALAVRAGEHALVGPDNGVLIPAARALATEDPVRAFEVPIEDPESATFHGRDVFAPAAADVHEAGVGAFPDRLGYDRVTDYETVTFPSPEIDREAGTATGEVLAVDGFGNAITNVPGGFIEGCFDRGIAVNGATAPVERSYAHVEPGTALVTVGSHGNVELAVNQGRGDEAFDVTVGDRIRLER